MYNHNHDTCHKMTTLESGRPAQTSQDFSKQINKSKYSVMKSIITFLLTLALTGGVFVQSGNAQDYIIERGDITGGESYTGGLRLCVVDRNEFYQSKKSSSDSSVGSSTSSWSSAGFDGRKSSISPVSFFSAMLIK